MKTKAILAKEGRYVIFIACAIALSSCHVYKPVARVRGVPPEELAYNIMPGKRYVIQLDNGQKVYMKVDSVMTDRVTGDARIGVNKPTVRSDNHAVYPNTILSVKERKVSVPLTIGMIAGWTLATMIMAYPGLDFGNFMQGATF